MEKFCENYNRGCCVNDFIKEGCGNFIPFYTLSRCDIDKLAFYLGQYEALNLSPDEIRQIIQDGEEIADACIEYKNRAIELEERLRQFTTEGWLTLVDKAQKYDKIKSQLEPFSFDDLCEWREKAQKYDQIKEALT